jgi:hypothetical protein
LNSFVCHANPEAAHVARRTKTTYDDRSSPDLLHAYNGVS